MKTIKFILNDDGSIASSSIGFQINQYSYNDTLINVYVPTEILNNQTNTETYQYSNNIVMAMYYTLSNGSQQLGNRYYFTFVKNGVVIEGKTYTLFERKMPKEFTEYYGTQNYAVNVVLLRTDISVTPHKTDIIGNVSSANFELTINQSINMADNPQEVDTDLSTLIAQVNGLLANILLKQDKQDNLIQVKIANGSLTTTDEVVAALNDLDARVEENYTTNNSQTGDITILDGRVTDLENQAITGFRYIGSITSSATPNATDLNNYATSQGITLQNGDVVLWLQTISGGTDKSYRCIWDYPNNWTWYEIPAIELASNDNAGLIKGNYQGSATNIWASIIGGEIKEIYYYDSNNSTFYPLASMLTLIKEDIANIVSGATAVGKALYATYDIDELNASPKTSIPNKYLTKVEGASKQFVQNYALPREFNDVYRLFPKVEVSTGVYENLFSDDETTSYASISSSLVLGDNIVLTAKSYLKDYYVYELSQKNSYKCDLWVMFDNDMSDVGLTLNIYYIDDQNVSTLVATTPIDRRDFTNMQFVKINFADYFNQIPQVDNTTILIDGGYYYFELNANTSSVGANDTIYIYSGASRPSTFSLSTDSYTLVTSQSGIILHEKEMTLDTSNGNVLIAELGSIVLADQSQHQFILSLPNGTSWNDIPEDCYFDIQINGTSIGYSINKKFINNNYIGFMSPFYNNYAFNFIATSLDDGNGGFYFDIVSEDNISYYLTRDYDVQYDNIEDKYYVSNEYLEMLFNNLCIIDFNALGIVNNFPKTTVLQIKDFDSVSKIYSFDYASYDDNTQAIAHYNIKLLYDNDNSKWYFECNKDGVYTQSVVNSLLNSKQDTLSGSTSIDITSNVVSLKAKNINNIAKIKNTINSINYFNSDLLTGKYYDADGTLINNASSVYLDAVDLTDYIGGTIKIISKSAFSSSSSRNIVIKNTIDSVIEYYREKNITPTLNENGYYELDIPIKYNFKTMLFSFSKGANVFSVSINRKPIINTDVVNIINDGKVLINLDYTRGSSRINTSYATVSDTKINELFIDNIPNNIGVSIFYRTNSSQTIGNNNTGWNYVSSYRVDISHMYDFAIYFRKSDDSSFSDVEANNIYNSVLIYSAIKTETDSVYVDGVNGLDTNKGTQSNPFKTIAKAISSGVKHIRIKYGEYAETITLSNASDYVFTSYGLPSFDSSTPDTPMIHLNGGVGKTISTGITLSNCSNITFENIWCDNTSTYGANITNCYNIVMNNCRFSNTFNDGLRLLNTNGTFNNCVAYNIGDSSLQHADGFNIHGYGDTTFNNCVAYDCLDDGISHHDACTGFINGGEFYRCGKGGVSSPTHGALINITGVYCHDNTKYGLYVDEDSDARTGSVLITNSIFKNNNLYDILCNRYTINLANCIYDTTTGTGTINNLNR